LYIISKISPHYKTTTAWQ